MAAKTDLATRAGAASREVAPAGRVGTVNWVVEVAPQVAKGWLAVAAAHQEA